MKNYLRLGSFLLLVSLVALASSGRADEKDDADAVDKLLKPDTGVGAKYGSRDPYKCPSAKTPEKGAPTAAQVRAYIIGQREYETGTGNDAVLYLTDNVTAEIGKGRPFEKGDGSDDIDTAELVYPIRGTITIYTCYPINIAHPAGKNCKKVEFPKAEGLCYKTTFGDWKCSLMDVQHRKVYGGYFPPPTAKK